MGTTTASVNLMTYYFHLFYINALNNFSVQSLTIYLKCLAALARHVQPVIRTLSRHQLRMRTGLNDLTRVHHENLVSLDHSTQSMRNGDRRPALFGFLESLLD